MLPKPIIILLVHGDQYPKSHMCKLKSDYFHSLQPLPVPLHSSPQVFFSSIFVIRLIYHAHLLFARFGHFFYHLLCLIFHPPPSPLGQMRHQSVNISYVCSSMGCHKVIKPIAVTAISWWFYTGFTLILFLHDLSTFYAVDYLSWLFHMLLA